MFRHKPVLHRNFVVAGRLFIEFPAMQDAAAFGVGCRKNKPADTGKCNRRGAHGAGLQRYEQIVFRNALGAHALALFPYYIDFGVGRGVGQLERPVAGTCDDNAAARLHQNRADGDLAAGSGFIRLFHRGLHMAMVLF